ncbi:hypothetical protein LTSEADE_4594, partial [Salmonella enterica subsp. enterica serovar Adelaide str. A4-669]
RRGKWHPEAKRFRRSNLSLNAFCKANFDSFEHANP